jgi:SSS family solute:Na+ symporter
VQILDWAVVAAFVLGVVLIGLYFTRRASKSVDEYFIAGRTIPWWLAGTSMLATSFASDTPLHTTRIIREQGLSGGWFYWTSIFGGVVIAFVFSRLWRRTGVVTDNQYIELRYSGKPAAVLRGGLALFKSVFLEILTMAWITRGMTKIVRAITHMPEHIALPVAGEVNTDVLVVVGLLVLTLTFSVASGYWGVVTTDLAEFSVAMIGAVVLAVVAMQKVGGQSGLRSGLTAMGREHALDFMPSFSGEGMSLFVFGIYAGVLWWSSAGVDGSGHRAQRLLSCKNEQHAIAAGVWSLAVTWLIRSWPWYVAALASLILYPQLVDGEAAYPMMVADLLPVGLKGLMVASFVSAFMATIEAHYNLCASYVLNDVYRRFLVKQRSDHHYVNASRWVTLGVAAVAGSVAMLLGSVLGAFRFKMELMSGLGLVFVLRWFWWRINAVTELVALGTSITTALLLNALGVAGDGADGSAIRLLIVVGVSAVAGIGTALLTHPEPEEHLLAFYKRVRPPGFWGPIAARATREEGAPIQSGFGIATVLQMVSAMIFVFCGMFGLGKVILGETALGGTLIAVAALAGTFTIRTVLRSNEPPEAELELRSAEP